MKNIYKLLVLLISLFISGEKIYADIAPTPLVGNVPLALPIAIIIIIALIIFVSITIKNIKKDGNK